MTSEDNMGDWNKEKTGKYDGLKEARDDMKRSRMRQRGNESKKGESNRSGKGRIGKEGEEMREENHHEDEPSPPLTQAPLPTIKARVNSVEGNYAFKMWGQVIDRGVTG